MRAEFDEDKKLMAENSDINALKGRFRGFYPVVIDVETAGFNAKTDALLEIAAITLKMDEDGWLQSDETVHFHVEPFEGSVLVPEALAFNGIDPSNPLRGAVSEYEALHGIFKVIRKGMKEQNCNRAIIVAHNANFDHSFLMAAAERAGLKRNPFHPFATFDTAALSGLVLGQTVLAKACISAGIVFDSSQAHSALYDTERTAELFCELVNRWKRLGGWPLAISSDENEAEETPEENQR
ncbi:ribonuclease T [Rahnella sp. PCH160]|uniref:ribonuclease T n=1 Tax=Rahnella sp. PCH160 TaxID=3447928 RepID=UPI0039FDD78B